MKPSVWARPMPATVDGQVKSKTPELRGQRHQESPPQQSVTNLTSQLQASHCPLERRFGARPRNFRGVRRHAVADEALPMTKVQSRGSLNPLVPCGRMFC